MSETDVVCLGILVADTIVRQVDGLPATGSLELVDDIALRGGGCALNTATVLRRFGLRVAVAGKVGADAFGDFVLGLLDAREVDRRGVVRDATVATSGSVALVDSRGERTFLHMLGANGALTADELNREILYSGRALHVGGALVMPGLDGEPFAALLEEARRRRVHTSLDTVWDPTGRWSRIEPCLPHLDLIVPSLAEAQAISGESEPERAADWLHRHGVPDVVLKLGADGCYVHGFGRVPAPKVHVVDGTGAGDAFAAGLLYGRLAGWPLERAARLANAAGALATTAVGAVEGVRSLDGALALARLQSLG